MTSMIYPLKTVYAESSADTNRYLMFAAAGGLLAVVALLALLGLSSLALVQAAVVLMLSAWGQDRLVAYRRDGAQLAPSSQQLV